MSASGRKRFTNWIPVPHRIAGAYLVLGALWILFSDKLLELIVSDPKVMTQLAIFKGWFYVAATALMLYALISLVRVVSERKAGEEVRRLNESRLEALLRLNQMAGATLHEITTFAMEEAVRLTQSTIGYVAFMNEDQTALIMHAWSREAMQECRIDEKPLLYPIETTGLWGEAVRQRCPIITNDYHAANPLKRGIPEGHVMVRRHMNVPIFDGNQIVIVAGVGNKATNYDEVDVNQLTLLMTGMWRIVQRKRVEDALHKSEERFRLLFNSSSDAVFVHGYNDDGLPDKFIEVNDIACQRLGYTRAELLQMSRADIDAPETYALIPGIMEELWVNKRVVWEGMHVSKDGRKIPVEISNRLFDFEGKPTAFATVRDITERKQAEAELRDSQERFQELAELLPETIFETDILGNLTFVNRNAFAHFGYSSEDLERGLNIFHMVSPEEVPKAIENVKRVRSGERIGLNEYKALRKDGSTFPAVLHSTRKLRDGKPVGFRGIIIDMTETKKLEAQLRQAHKMEAVGTLAGGIAHDFNNLLHAVQGYADLLRMEKTEGEEGYRELLEISRAARRGSELTRQLLTFSRKVDSKLEAVDLNSIVNDARMLLERTIPKMIKIELHLTGNLHFVNADGAQIEQILMNLAVNSRDAMPDGGTIIIETKNTILGEEYRCTQPELTSGEYVLLAVTDTGHGMDKSTLENMFDPFFTTKEVGKGTGLGLAMVYGIVKNHNGHITCTSTPGEGTSFEIYLPAIAHAKKIPTVLADSKELSVGCGTVLLVDDDDSVRRLGERILQKYGYKVISAPDGESALHIYLQGKDVIDMVILDLIMPGMGGTQCLQKLLEINPDARVVIASGYSSSGEAGEEKGNGAKAFINKPYNVQQILSVLQDVLK